MISSVSSASALNCELCHDYWRQACLSLVEVSHLPGHRFDEIVTDQGSLTSETVPKLV